MIGSAELLFIGVIIGYFLVMALLYTGIAHFFLFRKQGTPSKFWKNFKTYVGILILATIFKALLSYVLFYFEATKTLVLLGFFSHYLDFIFMFIVAMVVSYLAGIWIKYNDEKPIGFLGSFKVAGTVFILSMLFTLLPKMFVSDRDTISATVKRQESIDGTTNYKKVMNLPVSSELKKFKQVSGMEYGLFTNLEFSYYASDAYFKTLEHHKNFIQNSEWNKSFHQKDCYRKEVNKVCYEGIIFPYVHNLTVNAKTKFVKHVVTGMSD